MATKGVLVTSLTLLDHSSADALVANLKRYIGCAEALKTAIHDPPSVSMPWTLLDVGRGGFPPGWRGSASPLSLWVRSMFRGHYDDDCMLLCEGFGMSEPFLTSGAGPMFRLAACGPPQSGGPSSSVDDSRRRLDDNLRRIFA